jgi:hypothetical protein
MMIMEIPFPIPLSVIRSPSHIARTVPVDRMMMDENQNIETGILGEIAPTLLI